MSLLTVILFYFLAVQTMSLQSLHPPFNKKIQATKMICTDRKIYLEYCMFGSLRTDESRWLNQNSRITGACSPLCPDSSI